MSEDEVWMYEVLSVGTDSDIDGDLRSHTATPQSTGIQEFRMPNSTPSEPPQYVEAVADMITKVEFPPATANAGHYAGAAFYLFGASEAEATQIFENLCRNTGKERLCNTHFYWYDHTIEQLSFYDPSSGFSECTYQERNNPVALLFYSTTYYNDPVASFSSFGRVASAPIIPISNTYMDPLCLQANKVLCTEGEYYLSIHVDGATYKVPLTISFLAIFDLGKLVPRNQMVVRTNLRRLNAPASTWGVEPTYKTFFTALLLLGALYQLMPSTRSVASNQTVLRDPTEQAGMPVLSTDKSILEPGYKALQLGAVGIGATVNAIERALVGFFFELGELFRFVTTRTSRGYSNTKVLVETEVARFGNFTARAYNRAKSATIGATIRSRKQVGNFFGKVNSVKVKSLFSARTKRGHTSTKVPANELTKEAKKQHKCMLKRDYTEKRHRDCHSKCKRQKKAQDALSYRRYLQDAVLSWKKQISSPETSRWYHFFRKSPKKSTWREKLRLKTS